MSPSDSEPDAKRAPSASPVTPDDSPDARAPDPSAAADDATDRTMAPSTGSGIGDTTDVRDIGDGQELAMGGPTLDEEVGTSTLDEPEVPRQSRRYLPLQAGTPPLGLEGATDVVPAPRDSWRPETLEEEYTDVATNPRHEHEETGEITKERTAVSGSLITDIRTSDDEMLVEFTNPGVVPSFSDADPHQLAFAETSILDDEDELADEEEAPLDSLVGDVLLGRYRIEERIGRGGMATVYVAEHVTIGKEFAVKVLAPRLAESPVYVDRFLQEARAASMIRHPNVVDINDFGYTKEENLPFFVMELLEGEDLRDTLERERRLPWSRARPLALQICAALAAAHKAGIIHRDIKPENCFISQREGQGDLVKLLDFGIAKVTASDEPGILTAHGVVLGTVDYISPERALNKPVDARADIYSLGVLLYRMMTGRPPFEGVSKIDVITAHVYEEAPAPREIAPNAEIPAALEAVILKALAKDPAERYQSAVDIAAALEAIPGDAVAETVDEDDVLDDMETQPVSGTHRADPVAQQRAASRSTAPPLPALDSDVAPIYIAEVPSDSIVGPDDDDDDDDDAMTVPSPRARLPDEPDDEFAEHWGDSTALTMRSNRSLRAKKEAQEPDARKSHTHLVTLDRATAGRGKNRMIYVALALALAAVAGYLLWAYVLS